MQTLHHRYRTKADHNRNNIFKIYKPWQVQPNEQIQFLAIV